MNKRLFLSFLLLGIALRLLVSLLFTHDFDTFRIVALAKSVADNGSLGPGFFKIGTVQLYGLLFYQVIAVWMKFLSIFHIVDLRYLYDSAAYSLHRPDYMYLFPALGFELYQMTLVKLIQFVWDIPFLFGTLAIASTLNIRNRHWLVLFWAINPLLLHTGYILIQSDLAMMAFLVWGIYFCIRSLQEQKTMKHILLGVLSLLLLSGGAVIKQMPILLAPFFILLLSRSLKQFAIFAGTFALGYFLIAQPWTPDAALIKEHFLLSDESLALFGFNFNAFNVFFGFYIFLLLFFIAKKSLFSTGNGVLYLTLLVLCIVFLSESASNLYVQFMIWPLPFLEILALYNKKFAIFIVTPFLGFIKRALEDRDVFPGALSFAFGESYIHVLNYDKLYARFGNIKLGIFLLLTLFSIFCMALAWSLIKDLLNQKNTVLESFDKYLIWLDAKKVAIGASLATICIAIGMTYFAQQYLPLTHYNYVTKNGYNDSNLHKITTSSSFPFSVSNPLHHKITGFRFILARGGIIEPEHMIIEVRDMTNHILTTGSIDDFLIEEKPDEVTIMLSHAISNSEINVRIKQSGPLNTVYVISSDNPNPTYALSYPRNDQYYMSNKVYITKNLSLTIVDAIGAYTLSDMWDNLSWQLQKKPSIMRVYLGCIVGLLIISSTLLLLKRKQAN